MVAPLIHSPRQHRLRPVRGLQQLIKIHLLVSTTGGTRDLSFIHQPPGTALPVSIPPAAGGAPGPALSHAEMAQPCPSSCMSNPCSPPGAVKQLGLHPSSACSLRGQCLEEQQCILTDPLTPKHPGHCFRHRFPGRCWAELPGGLHQRPQESAQASPAPAVGTGTKLPLFCSRGQAPGLLLNARPPPDTS